MRFLPQVHRRVLGTWLCRIFLLTLAIQETGGASPTAAIIPFLASIPLLISYRATVFLVPDLILSSSTPPPAPRRHPTPIAASHDFSPPQGRWIVSYHTTLDDKTLYNIAIRRPLNGTARLITRKLVNWIAPDEFVGAPATGENDAALESQLYSTPMPWGLIDFPGLELGTRLEELHRLGTHFDNGRSVLTSLFDFKRQESCFTKLFTHRAHTDIALHPDSNHVAFVFGPPQLANIPPVLKSLLLVVEPGRSEAPIRTWKETLEAYDFVGIFALAAVAFVIFLTANAIEPMIVKAADKIHGAFVTTRLRVPEFCKGPCRRIAEFATRCLTAAGFIKPEFVPERLLTPMSSPRKAERWQLSLKQPRSGSILLRIPCSPQKKLAPKGLETGLPLEEIIKALNERLTDRRDKKPVGPPFLSPAWAKLHRPGKLHTLTKSSSSSLRKLELPPPEPRHTSSPLSKEEEKHQLWNGDGSINPLWIPLPPATDMEWDFLEGNTLTVTEDDQAEQGVALEVQAVPLNDSTDAAPNHPVVPPPLHPLASSPTTSETTTGVLGSPDSVPIDEKTEKEDLKPSAPNSSGIVPSAQVSGPMSDACYLGAPKLDSSSSVPLTTIERLRAILCQDIPLSTSQPSKPHDSGAAPSAQVSGSAPKTGFLGKRLEIEATVPSAKHSWKTAQANIDRIENANRRGRSSCRKRGATVARLDTIAEDFSDSTVSSDAPTVIVEASSSSISPPATTNAGAIQPSAGADEPSDSGADSSAQVSRTAPKTGFLAKLGSRRLEVQASVASARQSRMAIQANLNRTESGNERQRSIGRRKGATLARWEASCLDSIAEDLEDFAVSSNTAPIPASSSSSIPTPASTNTAAEPPTYAHVQDVDDHPLRDAPAAEDTVEEKPQKVVTFWHQVQVQYLPMSRWDREARRKFRSEAKEREIEDQYRVWAKGKQPAEGYRRLTTSAMKSVGGGPRIFFDDDDDDVDEEGFSKSEQKKSKEKSKRDAGSVFYGASTSRDGARLLSEDEWNRLEEFQAVRSNPAAKEVVRPQPEAAPMGVNVDVVFKFTFTLPVELPPPSLPPPVRTTPVLMSRRIHARINARLSATSIQRARRRAAIRP